jgi:hypothetical protein
MRSALTVAFVVALAASSAASAQGVGLRVGTVGLDSNPGGWIAPGLSVPAGDRAPIFVAAPLTSLYALDRSAFRAGDMGSLNGLVEPSHRLAPYLGFGSGKVPGAGVNFYFDLGVVYQDASRATDAGADRYSLERSLNRYNLYPVGQVGITVGF